MNPPQFISRQMITVLLSAFIISIAQAQTPTGKTVIKGTFLGDGKDGKLQYLIVQNREPFSDQSAIRLIFTEKDPSKSDKPDFDAGFKKLGSALILSVFKDGQIFGCEVAHNALPKSPFSSVGKIKITDMKVTDTEVSGHVTTSVEDDAFGQKWEVDLTFSAPLPKGAFAAASEPAAGPKKADKNTDDEPPVATGPKIPVADLPLPAAARDVEYKSVVEQIAFSSDASVSTVANDFSAKLKQKGWKESPGSLMGKSNAILKRKLNDAELTVMVQPAGKGCTVKVFAKGLDWSNPPASAAPQPDSGTSKPAKNGGSDDAEAKAGKLLNDALKKIPRGLIK
ncbi:MAG: hypothetical protein WCN98_03085 [Verrucomicrobiaceae bacterium]